MPRIVLADIGKRYGGGRFAVEHLDLDLPDGSFTAILGPSGCGKTTTLRMLAGLEQPTTGTISVGERVFSSASKGIFVPPHQRQLGLVFQNYALWPHLSVAKNVEFGLELKKVARSERRRRVAEVLDLLRVGHLADRLPAQLSGGEQQRVAIARSLAPNPSLVLFDEPLSNLDAPLRLELSTELKRLHRELGMTALLVTHDQAEAMAVATVLVVMRNGSVEQIGPPTEVYRVPTTSNVAGFLGSPPMNLLQPEGTFGVLRDLVSHDRSLTSEQPRWLGLRPEHVLVNDSRPGWRGVGQVVSVLVAGHSTIVHLTLGSENDLVALVPGETKLTGGDSVEVTVELDRVHLFDGDGRRLSTPREGSSPDSLPPLLEGAAL